ncbi:unnamed protein product, partial [Aphanomyces euteiches]
KNNKSQGEAILAISIAAKFEPKLIQLDSIFGGRKPDARELEQWRERAANVEIDVLKYITTHKPASSHQQRRQRKHTGFVPAIVRVWRTLLHSEE